MPREVPNCNSLRVQRAGQMNSLEAARLESKLQLLSKAQRRETRLHNQDMRIINLTLEYIQASSGHSPEGRPPDFKETTERENLAPCFMYGDRVISRKYSRWRKTQQGGPRRPSMASSVSSARTDVSATTATTSTDDSDDYTSTTSSCHSQSRPQSSPLRAKPRRPGSSKPRPGTALASIQVPTGRSATAGGDGGESDSDDPDQLSARISSAKTLLDAGAFLTQPEEDEDLQRSKTNSRPQTALRRSNSAKLNRQMSSASARSRASTPRSARPPLPPEMKVLERVIDLPVTSKLRQEKVMDFKKTINQKESQVITNRMNEYIKSLTFATA